MRPLFIILPAFLLAIAFADHYFVKEGSKVCIIMEADVTGKIYYTTMDNVTEDYWFNISSVNVEGSCGAENITSKQTMKIIFYPNARDHSRAVPWNLTLVFSHDSKAFTLKDYVLDVYLDADVFNTTSGYKTYLKAEKAETDIGAEDTFGFRCSDSALNLNNKSTVNLKNLRVVAFAHSNETSFSKEQAFDQCASDARTSEIVPIVVGACLAMLVIVVLIAYLIGRARAKREGYTTV